MIVMKDTPDLQTAVCPECSAVIQLSAHLPVCHLLLCPQCETLLVITAVHPLRLDWAFEEPFPPDAHYNPRYPRNQ
ncbi:MAG: hypothetical protein M5U34_05530 [Chloroflexi bacterium]|nr:hypothetical protein [Chloroflexota bacterium]